LAVAECVTFMFDLPKEQKMKIKTAVKAGAGRNWGG